MGRSGLWAVLLALAGLLAASPPAGAFKLPVVRESGGMDPVAFRQGLLADQGTWIAVLLALITLSLVVNLVLVLAVRAAQEQARHSLDAIKHLQLEARALPQRLYGRPSQAKEVLRSSDGEVIEVLRTGF